MLQSNHNLLPGLDSIHSISAFKELKLKHPRMKNRRLLLSLPLLPTITETLEDLPVHPSSMQQSQSAHSLEDYMSSIQALARTVEDPSYGPVRLQRSPRQRQLSKTARVSSRTPRTSRASSLSTHSAEEFTLRMSKDRDCRGKDPVDWLFGQIRT